YPAPAAPSVAPGWPSAPRTPAPDPSGAWPRRPDTSSAGAALRHRKRRGWAAVVGEQLPRLPRRQAGPILRRVPASERRDDDHAGAAVTGPAIGKAGQRGATTTAAAAFTTNAAISTVTAGRRAAAAAATGHDLVDVERTRTGAASGIAARSAGRGGRDSGNAHAGPNGRNTRHRPNGGGTARCPAGAATATGCGRDGADAGAWGKSNIRGLAAAPALPRGL